MSTILKRLENNEQSKEISKVTEGVKSSMLMRLGIIVTFLLSVTATVGTVYLYQTSSAEQNEYKELEAKHIQTREKLWSLQSESDQFKKEKKLLESENKQHKTNIKKYQPQIRRLQSELLKSQNQVSNLQAKMDQMKKSLVDAQKKVLKTQTLTKSSTLSSSVLSSGTSPVSVAAKSATDVVSLSGANAMKKVPSSKVSQVQETTRVFKPTNVVAEPKSVVSKTKSVPTPEVAPKTNKILTVNRKFNFVVVNVGLKDGLKMGDSLKVVRDGRELAVLQVEKLYDRFSAASILSEDQNAPVEEGDAIQKA